MAVTERAKSVRLLLASDVCALCFALQNGTYFSSSGAYADEPSTFAACFPDSTVAAGEQHR